MVEIAMPNKQLAFWQKANEVVKLARTQRGVVVMSTGVGKTTQTPQALYDAGITRNGLIYVSVPKRVLAVELAARVASEMRTPLGNLVGYQIRGESEFTRQTRILFMTEGVLRAKIRNNPLLKDVSCVLFDEFHQRTLMSDFNVALVERAQQEGSPVAFLLMSATFDPTYLAKHFHCQVVDGSDLATTFPIIEQYIEPERSLFASAAEQAARLIAEKQGNGLIFMPGKAEIEQTIDALRRLQLPQDITVLPLHGELESEARHAPFVERRGITVTVATDIVETGATLPRIAWVVDSGLARETRYDPIADISSLQVVEIAEDRLQQRRGRCGRERDGVYVGLFLEENRRARADRTEPEIKRVPLREVVLTIKALGLSREGSPLRLIDNPAKDNWKEAKKQLQALGFVCNSQQAEITESGRKAVELGCDPREAAMLMRAADIGCLREMTVAIAAMQSKRLLYRPRNEEVQAAEQAHRLFRNSTRCDAWAAISVVRAAEHLEESLSSWCRRMYVSYPALRDVMQISRQLLATMRALGYTENKEPGSEEALCQAIAAGFPDRIFEWQYGDWYQDQDGQYACLARDSVIRPNDNHLIAWEIRKVRMGRRGLVRLITHAAVV
jgi:HrpA-like RNA helicase